MINLYYWTTPNGQKPLIFLEEAGMPYKIHPVNISKGEQMKPEFLAISPNNKIPAMTDDHFSLFESGAILLYLAQKSHQFLPTNEQKKMKVMQWLFWQVGGLGPMTGQAMHFSVMAKEKIPYAIERYKTEVERLFKVADTELGENPYLGGEEYSIADMATYPWVMPYEKLGLSLDGYPNLKRWFNQVKERPAVKRAYAKLKEINPEA